MAVYLGTEKKTLRGGGSVGGSGQNGATFTPSIEEISGGHRLSWTNDQSLSNPTPVIIKDGRDGAPGRNGTDGKNGANGTNGKSAIISNATAEITDDSGLPSVEIQQGGNEFNRTFNFIFKNIKGERGENGAAGAAGKEGPQGPEGPKGDKPVKGVDYWTALDQQSIVNDVLAALPKAKGVSF